MREIKFGDSGEGFPPKRKSTKQRRTGQKFEDLLCACAILSSLEPPDYQFGGNGGYVCGSWVSDIWDCATEGMAGGPLRPPIKGHTGGNRTPIDLIV